MNFAPPQWVTEAANEALSTVAANHYSHPRGRVRLREAIKNYYDPLLGRSLDINSEIVVSSGANEGEELCGPGEPQDVTSLNSRPILGLHGLLEPWRRGHHVRAVLRSVSPVRDLQWRRAGVRTSSSAPCSAGQDDE